MCDISMCFSYYGYMGKADSMLDAIDKKILTALQEDARMANKEIAARVGIVPSATSERLRKLRERGVIKSFEARLDADRLSFGLVAFVFVRTNEMVRGCDTGKDLAAIPEVQEVFNVAGEDCYLLKVRTRDTLSLSKVLREKIGVLEAVTATRTTIVMESYKETCRLPLELLESNGAPLEK